MKLKYPVLLFYVFMVLAAAIIYLYMSMSQLRESNDALMQENDSLVSVKNRAETELRKLKPSTEFRYLK